MVSDTATILWYWTEEPTRSRSPRASTTTSLRKNVQNTQSSCSDYLTEVHTDSACVRTGKNFAKPTPPSLSFNSIRSIRRLVSEVTTLPSPPSLMSTTFLSIEWFALLAYHASQPKANLITKSCDQT